MLNLLDFISFPISFCSWKTNSSQDWSPANKGWSLLLSTILWAWIFFTNCNPSWLFFWIPGWIITLSSIVQFVSGKYEVNITPECEIIFLFLKKIKSFLFLTNMWVNFSVKLSNFFLSNKSWYCKPKTPIIFFDFLKIY